MKINLVFALAAVLAAAPIVAAPAADKDKKDEAAAESAGPTPEQLKMRKIVKGKPVYTKFDVAKSLAEKSGLPLFVAVLPDTPAVAFLKQKVLGRKEFVKEFAAQNCVVLLLKVKADSKNPKKIDVKPLKEAEAKFLENFAVSERAIQQAKSQNKDEPKFTDMNMYPCLICLDSLGQKELFRLGSYDREGGFGVWLSTVVDSFKTAGIEPTLSPLVQKIVDNPDDKKWK